MSGRSYIISLIFLFGGIIVLPEITESFKAYLSAVVAVISLAVNLVFTWRKFRDYVVNKLITEIIIKVIKDRDVRKILMNMEKLDDKK